MLSNAEVAAELLKGFATIHALCLVKPCADGCWNDHLLYVLENSIHNGESCNQTWQLSWKPVLENEADTAKFGHILSMCFCIFGWSVFHHVNPTECFQMLVRPPVIAASGEKESTPMQNRNFTDRLQQLFLGSHKLSNSKKRFAVLESASHGVHMVNYVSVRQYVRKVPPRSYCGFPDMFSSSIFILTLVL